MAKPVSALYRSSLDNVSEKIADGINSGCSKADKKPLLFFRADDIGIPSDQFTQMITLFKKYSAPLCLATVPGWVNDDRLVSLLKITGKSSSQWCWHQHGYVHRNYELTGKKQEFGPSRSAQDISLNLRRGRKRLKTLLKDDFLSLFTPPWNRCSQTTIDTLMDSGFVGMSRSRGASPTAPEYFPDFQVNVDLHTRKETSPETGFINLLLEIEAGLESGRCGIMLHHQRMNRKAICFLEILLREITKSQKTDLIHFGDLLPKQ